MISVNGTDVDKTNTLACRHAYQFIVDNVKSAPHVDIIVNNITSTYLRASPNGIPNLTNSMKIIEIIMSLRKKCPGWNRVSNNALKNLSRNIIILLIFVLNCCFKCCYISCNLKHVIIVSIHKSNYKTAMPGNA